jgi:hypothetical protein
MKIQRDYYPISDAAMMIGCTEADLIHLGANDKLHVYGLFMETVRGERACYDWESHESGTPQHCIGMGPYIIDQGYLKQIEAGKEPGECSVVWQKIDGGLYSFYLEAVTPDLFIKVGENPPITIMPGLFSCHEPPKLIVLTEDIERLMSESASVPSSDLTEFPVGFVAQAAEVTVTIPHMTKALEAVFAIMRENWTNPDPKRLPKQINIAREIDAALGLGKKGDPNSEPSRDAKTLAKIIKPDTIYTDEADPE